MKFSQTKFLWLNLIGLICLINVKSSDITGLWTGDWQNTADYYYCSPSSFVITAINSSSTLNITYYFTEGMILEFCAIVNITKSFSSTLIPNSTNTWTDQYYSELVYNSSLNIITYPFAPGQTPSMIYTRNQSLIPEDLAMGSIQGFWHNWTQVDPLANTSHCCIPDTLYIIPVNTIEPNTLSVTLNYTSTRCSGSRYYTFDIMTPNPQLLNWTGALGQNRYGFFYQSIYFSPNDLASQITFVLNNSDTSCSFYYQKYNQLEMLSGQWVQDWQSLIWNAATVYQIANVNNSYMASTINNSYGNITSVVYQMLEGFYYDPYLMDGLNFTYDKQIDTLIGIPTQDGDGSVIFSQNGSLISPTPFIGYWGNTSINNANLASNCCVPSVMGIANDSAKIYSLSVTYYFTQDLSLNPACQDLSTEIENGMITSELSILKPNISQLVWTDDYHMQVFFVNASTTSEITVLNFFNQCSFNMIPISAPPPPYPLCLALISYRIIYSIFGVFVILIC